MTDASVNRAELDAVLGSVGTPLFMWSIADIGTRLSTHEVAELASECHGDPSETINGLVEGLLLRHRGCAATGSGTVCHPAFSPATFA